MKKAARGLRRFFLTITSLLYQARRPALRWLIPIHPSQPRILKAMSPVHPPLILVRTSGLRPVFVPSAATCEVSGEMGAGDGGHCIPANNAAIAHSDQLIASRSKLRRLSSLFVNKVSITQKDDSRIKNPAINSNSVILPPSPYKPTRKG